MCIYIYISVPIVTIVEVRKKHISSPRQRPPEFHQLQGLVRQDGQPQRFQVVAGWANDWSGEKPTKMWMIVDENETSWR